MFTVRRSGAASSSTGSGTFPPRLASWTERFTVFSPAGFTLGWKAPIAQRGKQLQLSAGIYSGSPSSPPENSISTKKYLPNGKVLSPACLRRRKERWEFPGGPAVRHFNCSRLWSLVQIREGAPPGGWPESSTTTMSTLAQLRGCPRALLLTLILHPVFIFLLKASNFLSLSKVCRKLSSGKRALSQSLLLWVSYCLLSDCLLGSQGELVFAGVPGGASGKEPACQRGRLKRCGFNPWVGKIPWRRAWQPTPVLLPRESQGGGAWWATVQRVAKSRTRLKRVNTRAGWTEDRGLGSGVCCWDCTSKFHRSPTGRFSVLHTWVQLARKAGLLYL